MLKARARFVNGFGDHLGSGNGKLILRGSAGAIGFDSSGVAQRPAIKIPRPSALPPLTQSIQPMVIGHWLAVPANAERNSSMLPMRSLSCQIHGEAMRS